MQLNHTDLIKQVIRSKLETTDQYCGFALMIWFVIAVCLVLFAQGWMAGYLLGSFFGGIVMLLGGSGGAMRWIIEKVM